MRWCNSSPAPERLEQQGRMQAEKQLLAARRDSWAMPQNVSAGGTDHRVLPSMTPAAAQVLTDASVLSPDERQELMQAAEEVYKVREGQPALAAD